MKLENGKLEKKLLETSVFLGKLLAAGAVFHLVLFLRPDTFRLQQVLAGIVAAVLQQTGVETTVQGIFILVKDSAYRITQDCLGWKSMAAFTGLVFATDGVKRNYRFLAAGLGALFLVNIARIVSTVYLSHLEIISYNVIHGFLWKWALTVSVLLIWVWWLRRSEHLNNRTGKLSL